MPMVNSAPDSHGRFTRLNVNTPTTMTFLLIQNPQQQEVSRLKVNYSELFSIRFAPYDLTANKGWAGFFEYKPSNPPAIAPAGNTQTDLITLTYTGITAKRVNSPPAAIPTPGPIDVTVYIRKAVGANQEWIEWDIDHSYPSEIKDRDAKTAWEETINFPVLKNVNEDAASYLALPASQLQFTAVYKTGAAADGINFASGVALLIDDENGHHKGCSYSSAEYPGALSCSVLCPIHLLNGAYARPSNTNARYKLSGGDALGFGGHLMSYRTRIFQVAGACPGAPVEWHDVLNIYRTWLRTRKPSFCGKFIANRPRSAPGDDMSPHVLISNYGLDGAITGTDSRFPDLAKWLELHPIERGNPDTPSNPSEPVLDLLTRIQVMVDWEDLGGVPTSGPAVASWAADRMDCFVRGTDAAMYSKSWNGRTWSPWQYLGGPIKNAPAAVSWAANRIDVFARSATDTLWHKFYLNGAWSPWEDLGNIKPPGSTTNIKLASSPAVASWAPGRADVFVLGADNAVWHMVYDAQTRVWESLGLGLVGSSSPAAVSWGQDRIDLFVRGEDKALYHNFWNGQWHQWENLGGHLTSAPTVASDRQFFLHCFVRAGDDSLWRKTWNGASWLDWTRVGGDFVDDPAAIALGPDNFQLFVHGRSNTLLYKRSAKTEPKLEFQLWGFEMSGFYHYLGSLPPATGGFMPACNVLSGSESKFRRSMDRMVAHRLVPLVTTDPLRPIFNRHRFRGQFVWTGTDWTQITDPARWVAAIQGRWPSAYAPNACAIIETRIGDTTCRRVWEVAPDVKPMEPPPRSVIDPADPAPETNCGFEAARMLGAQKKEFNGTLSVFGPVLGNGLYRARTKPLCPIKDVEDIYVENWVSSLFRHGVRLIEFMKHPYPRYCYRREHRHLDQPSPFYDNIIGWGAWYIKRCQIMLNRLQTAGQSVDAGNSFMLTSEGAPPEVMIPFYDEYYAPDEYYNFLYSQYTTPKMEPNRDFAIHPGYREARNGMARVPPADMLSPARDTQTRPRTNGEIGAITVPAERAAAIQFRQASFDQWRMFCVGYFNANFQIESHGIAPKSYPIESFPIDPATAVPWNPDKPLDPTVPATYTYVRCVQDVFHLRATIFETGKQAIIGARTLIPAVWAEEPSDYNDESIRFVARAARMQMRYRDYFKTGLLLGRVQIISGNRELWAWGDPFIVSASRAFDDVTPVVENMKLGEDDPFGEGGGPGRDFISKAVDKIEFNEITIADQIQHRVWQIVSDDNRPIKTLYVFANVGNTDAGVVFPYGRGLEGTSAGASKPTVMTTISAAGTWEEAGTAYLGLIAPAPGVKVPARSFVGIEILF